MLSQPLLLWGLLGLAVPLAVHLLLRERPRTLRFPALRLMRDALVAGTRANRLRSIGLLLLRCALVMLVVVVLSGPNCAVRRSRVARLQAATWSSSSTTRPAWAIGHGSVSTKRC
jgi:hypothetical protein